MRLLSREVHHLAARIFAMSRAEKYAKCVGDDAARMCIEDAETFERAWQRARLDLDGLPVDDLEQQAAMEGYCDERR